jgi:hypothetical protein
MSTSLQSTTLSEHVKDRILDSWSSTKFVCTAAIVVWWHTLINKAILSNAETRLRRNIQMWFLSEWKDALCLVSYFVFFYLQLKCMEKQELRMFSLSVCETFLLSCEANSALSRAVASLVSLTSFYLVKEFRACRNACKSEFTEGQYTVFLCESQCWVAFLRFAELRVDVLFHLMTSTCIFILPSKAYHNTDAAQYLRNRKSIFIADILISRISNLLF